MSVVLPFDYRWLQAEPGPKMLIEALKLYGIKEIPGAKSNPVIMGWAKHLGVDNIYKNDDDAWCSVAHAFVATSAGKEVPMKGYDLLRAKEWANFGNPMPLMSAMLGDTLIFNRPGGYHVGLYVGEDYNAYHVLGGNQSNQYGFTRISKDRLFRVRRPVFKTGVPANLRKVTLSVSGELSQNEG